MYDLRLLLNCLYCVLTFVFSDLFNWTQHKKSFVYSWLDKYYSAWPWLTGLKMSLKNTTISFNVRLPHLKEWTGSLVIPTEMDNIEWQLQLSCTCFPPMPGEPDFNVQVFVFRVITPRSDGGLKRCYQLSNLSFSPHSSHSSRGFQGNAPYSSAWKQ